MSAWKPANLPHEMAGGEWLIRHHGTWRVYATSAWAERVDGILAEMPRLLKVNQELMGFALDKPTRLFFLPPEAPSTRQPEWRAHLKDAGPHGGYAFSDGTVLLNLDESTGRVSPGLVAHELNHVFYAQGVSDDEGAEWFIEALAEYVQLTVDGPRPTRQGLRPTLLRDGVDVSLARLKEERARGTSPKGRDNAAILASTVVFLRSVHGADAVARILALTRKRTLNAALLEVTGCDATELEADWRRWYDLKPLPSAR